MNRREFLKWLTLASAAALNSCSRQPIFPTDTATPIPPTREPSVTQSPYPTFTPTMVPSPSSTPDLRPKVGITRAASYDPVLVRNQLEILLDGIGGLSDLVKSGARVGIKPNLTGGTWWDAQLSAPASEIFVTHPAVVGALAELCRDCGASQISIIEGLGDPNIWQQWGYHDMADPLGVQLVDLCYPDPYTDFQSFPVGDNSLAFDHFMLNPILGELDVLISVAKMKTHTTTGITLTMKNLVGLTPLDLYKRQASDTSRTALHNTVNGFDDLMPRVIVDLNRACPVQLGLVDGILTCEGAVGPWNDTLHLVSPGLLLAGRDAVAVDAVTAAVMGFDPETTVGNRPFFGGDNIMALACEAGVGTNRLSEINVTGETIDAVRYPFKLVGEA